MYMINKVMGARFPSDVKHKPLRPPVSKNPKMPSPKAPEQEEHETEEEGEDRQRTQQHGATQGGTGLTGLTGLGLNSIVTAQLILSHQEAD